MNHFLFINFTNNGHIDNGDMFGSSDQPIHLPATARHNQSTAEFNPEISLPINHFARKKTQYIVVTRGLAGGFTMRPARAARAIKQLLGTARTLSVTE